jgi:ferritin-like metal-binding protein YciE
MQNLQHLFEEQIQDLYSGESQILEALPDMIDAAKDNDLRSALEEHLEVTKEQKRRLERIASELGFEPNGESCKGMEGILDEGEELVEREAEEEDTRDAAIVAAAQRVEHYEMAAYGTARTYARMLGHDKVARTLQETLDEEREADEKLSRIAESHVNRAAMA